MNNKANRLLADVREIVTELHYSELTDQDCEPLQLMVDILRQIRAGGVPEKRVVYDLTDRTYRYCECKADDITAPSCAGPDSHDPRPDPSRLDGGM